MLFSSFQFIFQFLPCVVIGYFLLQHLKLDHLKVPWLLLSSFGFYLFWNPSDLIPLIVSSSVNFLFFRLMALSHQRVYLAIGIAFNLVFLGWYKYACLFFQTAPESIPLGISFYTFTQIAFLVDSFRQRFRDLNLLKYNLFVSYFPHLVCGPILIFKDFYYQLTQKNLARLSLDNITYFFFFFSIGLFKKTFIADPLGLYVTSVFDSSSLFWIDYKSLLLAMLCYSFQIYADFSGYSDMAVGLSRLFGIVIPFNFNSPYQSTSIIEFWRKWHMSLSAFLKNYLYIPLGGNQCGQFRQYFNLLIVMTLGGIWHGANVTFLIWGIYHGFLLIMNHLLGKLVLRTQVSMPKYRSLDILKGLIVFLLVSIGWIFFRSNSVDQAFGVLSNIFLFRSSELSVSFTSKWQNLGVILGVFFAFFLKEPQVLYSYLEEKFQEDIKIRLMLPIIGCIMGTIFSLGLLGINKPQQFLYSGF